MKTYELTYLISAEKSEEEAKAVQDRNISFISEQGGILNDAGIVIKKKLAYPVKKNPQAFLSVLEFQLNPNKIADLEKNLKETKEILRYIIINNPIRKREKKERKPVFKSAKQVEQEKEKKVELIEIEKKLDEILDEDESK